MAKVLISAKLDASGPEALRAYEGIEVEEIAPLNGAELIDKLQGSAGLIVRSESKVTAEVIEKCPDLKVIGRAGTGYDNIDAKAAAAKDIAVLIAPGGNTVTTAEHTLALMFALARHIPQANRKLVGGEWDRGFKGIELTGKTLGVVGLGNIGAVVAERAFYPTGEERAASGFVDELGFTGQERDATGLLHFRARYLDPASGRGW